MMFYATYLVSKNNTTKIIMCTNVIFIDVNLCCINACIHVVVALLGCPVCD